MEEMFEEEQKENFDYVFEMLKNVYKDYVNVDEKFLLKMARALHEYVFLENGYLNYIHVIVFNYEEAMRARGAVIKIGLQCLIFTKIINALDIDENNANRLYQSFLGYYDCQVFSYLMNDYEKWLSSEQREKVLSIAKTTFIKNVWESYV